MIPETCDVGFKEWAGICEALASGRQSIILRKGGIDEVSGPGVFIPQYPAFWLYPTHLHESQQGSRDVGPVDPDARCCPPGKVPISTFAVAETIGRIEDEQVLDGLREFHAWTDETIRKRFHYRSPGLWVLASRAYSRDTPYILDVTPEQEGCKSWVPLGQSLSTGGLRPAIDNEAWRPLMSRLHASLKRT